MSQTYTFSKVLERLFTNQELTSDEREWAEQKMTEGKVTPGQIAAYRMAQQQGWKLTDALKKNLDRIESLLRGVPMEGYHIRPASNEWSIQHIIGHLADNEMVNAIRIRYILTEQRPELIGYDSDDWERFFELDDVWTAFFRWKAARQNLLRLIETLSESEWKRTGYLSYRGEESIIVLLGVLAGHDERHISQLERVAKFVIQKLRTNSPI